MRLEKENRMKKTFIIQLLFFTLLSGPIPIFQSAQMANAATQVDDLQNYRKKMIQDMQPARQRSYDGGARDTAKIVNREVKRAQRRDFEDKWNTLKRECRDALNKATSIPAMDSIKTAYIQKFNDLKAIIPVESITAGAVRPAQSYPDSCDGMKQNPYSKWLVANVNNNEAWSGGDRNFMIFNLGKFRPTWSQGLQSMANAKLVEIFNLPCPPPVDVPKECGAIKDSTYLKYLLKAGTIWSDGDRNHVIGTLSNIRPSFKNLGLQGLSNGQLSPLLLYPCPPNVTYPNTCGELPSNGYMKYLMSIPSITWTDGDRNYTLSTLGKLFPHAAINQGMSNKQLAEMIPRGCNN